MVVKDFASSQSRQNRSSALPSYMPPKSPLCLIHYNGDFEISWGNNKFFDMMVYRVVVLTNVLGDCQFPGSVVVGQTLRNQERPMDEILRKVLAEIENQLLRRAATIGRRGQALAQYRR